MRTRFLPVVLVAVALTLPAAAQQPPASPPTGVPTVPAKPPKPVPVVGGALKGKPADYQVDKAVGCFLWLDEQGLHVRWTTTPGKPILFAGRVDTDRPLKELTRITDTSSGWVKNNGDRIVMFSTTSRGGEDGFDLTIPGVRKLLVELKIDGNDPLPEQVTLGARSAHPTGFPMSIGL